MGPRLLCNQQAGRRVFALGLECRVLAPFFQEVSAHLLYLRDMRVTSKVCKPRVAGLDRDLESDKKLGVPQNHSLSEYSFSLQAFS